MSKLKRVHSIAFSFAIWDEMISKAFKDENKKIFVKDLRSDIVQAVPLMLLGYKKATTLLLRSTIENILKHVFFFDHRVEFALYKKTGYYPRRDELCKYIQEHPGIGTAISKMNVSTLLSTIYVDLSRVIHGKTIVGQEFADCLKKIRFHQKFYVECCENIYLFGNLYNFILLNFHRDIATNFDAPSRKFILSKLSKKAYQIFARSI